MRKFYRNYISWRIVSLLFFCLTGCATGSSLVWHSFDFDARLESPDIEILAYRYGNSKQPGASSESYRSRDGRVVQATGINGEMLLGDELYVKWRIKKQSRYMKTPLT
jgi:hypothetical protein